MVLRSCRGEAKDEVVDQNGHKETLNIDEETWCQGGAHRVSTKASSTVHQIDMHYENSPLLERRARNRDTQSICRGYLVAVSLVLASMLVGIVSLLLKRSFPVSLEITNFALEAFDYIIVGGGPSGILVATQLAKRFPHLRLLLLESGTESQSEVLGDKDLNFMDIPLFWSEVSRVDKGRQRLPMGHASGHHWPIEKTLLGRGLGGSGLHNAMIYIRALPEDVESWNMTDWSWNDLHAEYTELEDFTPSSDQGRGRDGPIVTSRPSPRIQDPLASLFIESAAAQGWRPLENGFNGKDRVGAGVYEFNIRHGLRDSVAQALLGRRQVAKNLEIRTGCTVTRVIFDQKHGKHPRATGVEYQTTMGTYHVAHLVPQPSSEVILSAGAIMTPQVLANSGIGPEGNVADLPGVGRNLQDHPVVALSFKITPNQASKATSIYTLGDEFGEYLESVQDFRDIDKGLGNKNTTDRTFLLEQLGTLGTAGFSSGAFLRSPYATNSTPDIQLTVFPRVIEPHILAKVDWEDAKRLRSTAMLITVALLKPEARYQVYPEKQRSRLTRGNVPGSESSTFSPRTGQDDLPFNTCLPVIDLPPDRAEYLTMKDKERLAWGIEEVRRIQQLPPLSLHATEELYPGPKIEGPKLRDYVAVNHLPNSHWVGTSKMGIDPDSVVDGRLQVHGVMGLRIADGSVLPRAVNGNTHSTVCAVASRASKLIAQERDE